MTHEEMARKAALNLVCFMTVKWAVIFGVTRALRKAAERAS